MIRLLFPVLLSATAVIPTMATPLSSDSIPSSRKELKADADSLDVVNLQEVVVQGRTQRVIKNGVEYIPDKKTRRNASDATNLLLKMVIPQLDVNPITSEVKTNKGEEISYFIDYRPALEGELKGLRTEDVLRVEVLDFPEDPRFRGEFHVVNFVMVQYEWGGYTKLSYDNHFLADNYNGGSLYSKFAYKKMTFDAYVGGGYNFLNRNPYTSTEIYRDVDFMGNHYDEIRRVDENGIDYKSRNNYEYASFSATYQVEKIYMVHGVSFNRSADPVTNNLSRVSFSIPGLQDTESFSASNSQSLSPSLYGNYYFSLPKGNTLFGYWQFVYGGSKSNSSYTLKGFDPIINNNREKTYTPNVQIGYSKNFAGGSVFRSSIMSYNNIYHIDYSGSYADKQNIVADESMLFLEYIKNWPMGLYLYTRAGVSYVLGRINGHTTRSEWNPRLGFQLQYKINEKHSASVDGWWGNSHVDPATASEALIQSSELMWHQGNPDLRNTLFASANASYTYIPTNIFSMTATFSYEGNPHKQAYEFYTLSGHDGLIRRSINSGSGNEYTLRLSANLRLLDNALSFRISGRACRSVLTGVDALTLNNVSASVYGQYMRDHWSVSLNYSTPSKYAGAWSNGYVTKSLSNYGVSASVNFGEFKATFSFVNWFRKDYKGYTYFNSPLFSTDQTIWYSNRSRRVELSLSYTFPYGKKISRDRENININSAGSAVLK